MITPNAQLAMANVYSGERWPAGRCTPTHAWTTRSTVRSRNGSRPGRGHAFVSRRTVLSDKSVAEAEELERGLRRLIDLRQALANADSYLNEMEQLSYQRQHGGDNR